MSVLPLTVSWHNNKKDKPRRRRTGFTIVLHNDLIIQNCRYSISKGWHRSHGYPAVEEVFYDKTVMWWTVDRIMP